MGIGDWGLGIGPNPKSPIHVVEAQNELQDAVNEGCHDTPFPAVAMADHDEGQHTHDGDAAAEGQVDLDEAQHRGDGDEQGALHELSCGDFLHGFSFRFPKETGTPAEYLRRRPMTALLSISYAGIIRIRFQGPARHTRRLSRLSSAPLFECVIILLPRSGLVNSLRQPAAAIFLAIDAVSLRQLDRPEIAVSLFEV